jgi:hypothetical protein
VDLSDDKEEIMIDQVVGKVTIPTDADLLMAYATTPGKSEIHRGKRLVVFSRG